MALTLTLFGLLLFEGLVAPDGDKRSATAYLTGTHPVKISFYCPCEICCGIYAGGPTASGRMPKEGRTIAAPRNIPFGTRVYVEGYGWRVVEDRTKSGKGWDMFVTSHTRAVRKGIRRTTIYHEIQNNRTGWAYIPPPVPQPH